MPINNNKSNQNIIIIKKKRKKKLNKITLDENSYSSENNENSKCNNEFDFKLYELLLFDKNAQIIFNLSKIDFNTENKIPLDNYSNIIKNIIKINENSKIKKKTTLHYYLMGNENINIQILNIKNTDIYLLGAFDKSTHSSIRKIFLLHILLSFLNYMGEKSWYIKRDFEINRNGSKKSINSEKKIINAYSNKSSIISSDNNNYLEMNENNDLLYSKIYEYFLLLPLIKFFVLISKNIFIRHNYYNKGALYKNFYLVDLEAGQILFSLENIYGLNNGEHPDRNILLNQLIFEELLYQGKFLKKDYIKKYGKILDFIDYQQFYIRLEFKSTHPKLIFILRFLPLLNGILLIQEYEMKTYSIGNDDDEEEDHKEIDILVGNSITRDEETENEDEDDEALLINEPKFIKEREYFFINFFLSTNSNINNIFYLKNSQIKYFSEDVLNIINKIINKNISESANINIENILLNINNELYNEYLQINYKKEKNPILISSKKVIYKKIKYNLNNETDIINLELLNEDNTKIINQYQWNCSSLPYLKNLFQIEEKYILIILFNYRNDIKNNQLTLDLSRLESYSLLDKENIDNNNKIKNNNNNIISKDEKLSQLLNDELSQFSESLYLDKDKNYYKDKKGMIKKVKTVNFSKNKNCEISEENKISDEEKSKDKMNILFDNDKSSIFNLDFTYISKNDIGLYDSFKIDKNNKINNNQLSRSSKKKSEENHKISITHVNTLNLKKNPLNFNYINKKNNVDNNKIEAKEKDKDNTNVSLLPIQVYDKSYEEKDKKDLQKKFLDLYQDTIFSEEKYYKYEKNNKNTKEDN